MTGALDANSTADIADTLTLSKTSGTGLEVTSNATVGGTLAVSGNTTLSGNVAISGTTTVSGSIIPSTNNGSIHLGSDTNRFGTLFVNSETINIGGVELKTTTENGVKGLDLGGSDLRIGKGGSGTHEQGKIFVGGRVIMEHIVADGNIDLTSSNYSTHTYVSVKNNSSSPIYITYNMNLNQYIGEQGTYIDGHFQNIQSQGNVDYDMLGIYDLTDLDDVDYSYKLATGEVAAFMKVNFSPVVWNHDGGIDISHLPSIQGGNDLYRHIDDRDDGMYDTADNDTELYGINVQNRSADHD